MSVHFSSVHHAWETPIEIVEYCENRWGKFDLDVAADKNNAKAPKFYTIEDDALKIDWRGTNVWCNPPYGRGVQHFTDKAIESVRDGDVESVVFLVAARTDTKWFNKLVGYASHVLFL